MASNCLRASPLCVAWACWSAVVTVFETLLKPTYAIASAGALSARDGEKLSMPLSGAPVTTPFTRTPPGSAAMDAAITAFWYCAMPACPSCGEDLPTCCTAAPMSTNAVPKTSAGSLPMASENLEVPARVLSPPAAWASRAAKSWAWVSDTTRASGVTATTASAPSL